jgi:hypothetical protein
MTSRTANELRKYKSDIYDSCQQQYTETFSSGQLSFGRKILTPFESTVKRSSSPDQQRVLEQNVHNALGDTTSPGARPPRIRKPDPAFFDPFQKDEVAFHIHGNRTLHEDGKIGSPFLGNASLVKQNEHDDASDLLDDRKRKAPSRLSPVQKFEVPLTESQQIGWALEKRKAAGVPADSAPTSTAYFPAKASSATRYARAMYRMDRNGQE